MDVDEIILPLELSTVTEKLGYTLQDWQRSLMENILEGKDVVLTAGTGQGKMTLLYAPLLVTRLRKPVAIGLSIVPTKALGLDQVYFLLYSPVVCTPEYIPQERSANSKGIQAAAVNEDTVCRASDQERDLFKEVLEGRFALVIVSPEMLASRSFNQVLQDSWFQMHLCLIFVDECDLVEAQGSSFRPCYKSISDLRARLPTSIPWVAVSATLPQETFDHVMNSLGFNHGRYIYMSLPIDNPNICYVPRFRSYPTSTNTFLDLAWLIPPNITSITDITKTLIFCETIASGHNVERFLKCLLPPSLSSGNTIRPYHSLISDHGRSHTMESFRAGTTRIVIATDCFTWGVDVPDIRNVILFDLPASFSKLVQQIGRAGRDKEQAYAITYAPPWVKEIPSGLEKGTKREGADLAKREGLCPAVQSWFNPTETSCPRDVLCLRFGEVSSHPQNCCIIHHKDLPKMEPDRHWISTFTPKRTKAPIIHSDRTYAPFSKKDDSALCDSISRIISTWTRKKWAQTYPLNTLQPPGNFLSEVQQNRLCEKFHAITSIKALSTVLYDWPHLKEHGEELYSVCEEALEGLDKLRKEARAKRSECEAEERKSLKIQVKLFQPFQAQREELCGVSSSDDEPTVLT